jgi:hypothetical protein
MAHYNTLFDHIAGLVEQAWNITTTAPGRSAKPLAQLPRAVITLESCARDYSGRSVEQTWTWTIGGQFGMPTMPGVDAQELMAQKAEALINLLTPFSESSNSIPAVPSPFAGIGYLPMASEWSPVPLDDAENACAVIISFMVRTTVWQ